MPIFLFWVLFTLGARAAIIFLPLTQPGGDGHLAVACMTMNDPRREVSHIAGHLILQGFDLIGATRRAWELIKVRDEAILSQFKVYHHLKALAQENPEILVGQEGCFLDEGDHEGDSLLLGEHRYPWPKTYHEYLSLRQQHPELAPRFVDEKEQPLALASPFGVFDARFSFGQLDSLRSHAINITDDFQELTIGARLNLAFSGALSIAVSQGIIRNVIAVDDLRQEIYRLECGVRLSREERDRKDLNVLRVYSSYLKELSRSQMQFEHCREELNVWCVECAWNPERIPYKKQWFFAHVCLRMAAFKLLEAIQVFKPRLAVEDWGHLEKALSDVCQGTLEDQGKNIEKACHQVRNSLSWLKRDFLRQKQCALREGRERTALSRIKDVLGKDLSSRDVILIYDRTLDFLRYSSDELPIVSPAEIGR